ncbi:MAG: hypothetical protein KC912_04180 [Proteobacteria bacterium]|nr:hypothetical protein [Pseudomonadota bacterium]
MSVAPYSFDRTGSIQACADGPEILVYSADGLPMWQEFLEGIAVGVAAANQRVATVDTDGRLVSFRAHDGTRLVDTQLDVAARGLRSAADGRLATWADDCILLASADGEPYRMEHPGASSVVFGGDGDNQLGVVGADGLFHLYDIASGQVLHTLNAGVQLLDVAYSALGQWVALAADRLLVLEEVAATKEAPASFIIKKNIALPGVGTALALASDGVVAAVLGGERHVWLLEIWTDRQVGTIEVHRTIGEIEFGVGNMLGIGLEDGEANRVNASVGGHWRTSPGFGRGGQNWAINVSIDQMLLRKAVIDAKGGGQPVAQLVYGPDGKSNGCLYGIVGFFAVGLICGGCSGVAGMIYAFS